MRIAWKKSKNLKPSVILNKIAASRCLSEEGKVSFLEVELEPMLVALQSMLEFPEEIPSIDKSTLIWKALSSISTKLTTEEFESTINKIFDAEKATKEVEYHVLTSISMIPDGLHRRISINGATIELLKSEFPQKYNSRAEAITLAELPVRPTPGNYTRVIIRVREKSPNRAVTRALRTIDLYRAALCLLCNSRMEVWGKEWVPINKIRLGGTHSVHFSNGKTAKELVWFEPGYTEAPIYSPSNGAHIQKQVSIILGRMFRSSYFARLSDALLRYVRALDERDQNNACIKLWGALEAITTQDPVNYSKTIQRCSFIFHDRQYHSQILESLREYRNQTVHAGDQGGAAKIHCFDLQYYFSRLIFFHLSKPRKFASFDEANQFLDLSQQKETLRHQRRMIGKALRFVM